MSLKTRIREFEWNKVKKRILKLTQLFLCKLKKIFLVKVFSKGQMLIFCFIIVSGTFLYQDVIKFGFFIFFILITWLTGTMGLRQIRHVLEKAEQAINSPIIPIDKKYVEAVGAVHTSCAYLGTVMDKYNLQQGTAPYLRDLIEKAGGEKTDG